MKHMSTENFVSILVSTECLEEVSTEYLEVSTEYLEVSTEYLPKVEFNTQLCLCIFNTYKVGGCG